MKVLFVRENGISEFREVQSPGELIPGLWIEERPFINKNIVVVTSVDVERNITTLNRAVTYRKIYGPVVFIEAVNLYRSYTNISDVLADKLCERFSEIRISEREKECTETCVSWWERLTRGLANLLRGRR